MSELPHADNWIAKNTEVGPGGLPLDFVFGIRFAGIEVSEQRRGEMPARGRTDDADTFGIELPFLGACAHHAQRPSSILQHHGMAIPSRTEPIFKDEPRNAALVEETSILFSLM